MQERMANETKGAGAKKHGNVQLLAFKLDEQEYALKITDVVQVIRMVALTRAPQAPAAVVGIFNLRGKVVPVIDLRKQFGLTPKPYDLNTQLLITRANGQTIALTVDVVSEVLTLPTSNIETREQIGAPIGPLAAVGKRGERLVLILNPTTLLPQGYTGVNEGVDR